MMEYIYNGVYIARLYETTCYLQELAWRSSSTQKLCLDCPSLLSGPSSSSACWSLLAWALRSVEMSSHVCHWSHQCALAIFTSFMSFSGYINVIGQYVTIYIYVNSKYWHVQHFL